MDLYTIAPARFLSCGIVNCKNSNLSNDIIKVLK